jgi:hypothetical protein
MNGAMQCVKSKPTLSIDLTLGLNSAQETTKSSNRVQSPRLYFEKSPSARTSKGFVFEGDGSCGLTITFNCATQLLALFAFVDATAFTARRSAVQIPSLVWIEFTRQHGSLALVMTPSLVVERTPNTQPGLCDDITIDHGLPAVFVAEHFQHPANVVEVF